MHANQNPATITFTVTGIHTRRAVRFLPDIATVTVDDLTATVTVAAADYDALLASIPEAKATQINEYLARGGNRRNVRGFASTWTAVRKAVEKAGR